MLCKREGSSFSSTSANKYCLTVNKCFLPGPHFPLCIQLMQFLCGKQGRQTLTELIENYDNWKDTGAAHRMKSNAQKPGLEKGRIRGGAEDLNSQTFVLAPWGRMASHQLQAHLSPISLFKIQNPGRWIVIGPPCVTCLHL